VSAAFANGDDLVWGTNGAIEVYLEHLAASAAARFGADDPQAEFFRLQRAAFNMGTVVRLDELLGDAARRARLLAVFDAATIGMRDCGELTAHGLEWLAAAAPQIRRLIGG
jgi:hypothetical protein